MVLARITFHAKFGKAGQVVEMLKLTRASRSGPQRVRIMTDRGGRFDTVTLEIEAESMAEYELGQAEMMADPQHQQRDTQMNELTDWGSIEFYNIVE